MKLQVFYLIQCLYMMSRDVEGHGRLVDPPSRASAWRYGFNTPVNYDDNQLFCGGKSYQWDQHGGRCGVCGDPYGGPRDHEAGGRYATGTIVRSYRPGQIIDVTVELTANHKGWIELKLCPNNNLQRRVTQSCLDRFILPLADGSGTRLTVSSDMYNINTRVQLPRGLTCTQCVLQWKYNAGNSWGVDPETGKGCVGCGPQEQFYGCADIAIATSNTIAPHRPQKRPQQPQSPAQPWSMTQTKYHQKPLNPPTSASKPKYGNPYFPRRRPQAGAASIRTGCGRCVAKGPWSGQAAMSRWCQTNCEMGHCPTSICECS